MSKVYILFSLQPHKAPMIASVFTSLNDAKKLENDCRVYGLHKPNKPDDEDQKEQYINDLYEWVESHPLRYKWGVEYICEEHDLIKESEE